MLRKPLQVFKVVVSKSLMPVLETCHCYLSHVKALCVLLQHFQQKKSAYCLYLLVLPEREPEVLFPLSSPESLFLRNVLSVLLLSTSQQWLGLQPSLAPTRRLWIPLSTHLRHWIQFWTSPCPCLQTLTGCLLNQLCSSGSCPVLQTNVGLWSCSLSLLSQQANCS